MSIEDRILSVLREEAATTRKLPSGKELGRRVGARCVSTVATAFQRLIDRELIRFHRDLDGRRAAEIDGVILEGARTYSRVADRKGHVPAVAARPERRIAPEPMAETTTALLMGDPPRGRRALDMPRAEMPTPPASGGVSIFAEMLGFGRNAFRGERRAESRQADFAQSARSG